MNNQSPFVKFVIWFMVFLMSVGFIGLVIAPFLGGSSLFGSPTGREATQEIVDEAREDARKDDCSDEKDKPSGKRLERCKEALTSLASSYQTLALPDRDDPDQEQPRDAQRNIDRAGEAWELLYQLDPKDEESKARYAGYLRDTGKAEQSLKLWTELARANPDDEDYQLQVAAAHEAAGSIDKAIATYRAFIKKFPDSGQIDAIEGQIENLQEQQAQQAAGGGQQPTVTTS